MLYNNQSVRIDCIVMFSNFFLMHFACLLDIKCSHCDGVDPQFHSHSRLCSSILSEYIGGGDQSRKFKWLEIHLIHWGNPNGQENQNDWNFQKIHLQLFVEQHYHNIYKELTMQWGQKPCFPGSNFWSKLNHVIQNASHWFFSTPKKSNLDALSWLCAAHAIHPPAPSFLLGIFHSRHKHTSWSETEHIS